MYARHFAVRPPGKASVVRPELMGALELVDTMPPPVRLVLVTLTGPGQIGASGHMSVTRVLERHEVTLADEEGPVPEALRYLTPEEGKVWSEYLSPDGFGGGLVLPDGGIR